MLSSKILASALALAIAPVCFAADGDLDPSFGTAGIAYVAADMNDAQELQPVSAIVLDDGKILLGGSLDQPTSVPFEQQYRGMLARLNADGTVDETFGNTSMPGVVALPNLVPGNRMEGIESMRRLDDGAIIAVGTSMVNTPTRGFVVKLDDAGHLDTTFGNEGIVLMPATYTHTVGIDSQGRIVAAGEHVDSSLVYVATVMRFAPDGTPDASFGDNGIVALDWDGAGNSGYLADLMIDADDGIVVAGAYDVYGDGFGSDFAIAKLDASGAPDATFGDGGSRVFHDPSDPSTSNAIQRIAATAGGGIAFAGYFTDQDSATALVIGHLGADGSTDASFGDAATPGYFRPAILASAQSVNTTELVVQDDGKLLATLAYYSLDKEDFAAIRTTSAGQLDDSFATAGVFDADLAPTGAYSEASAMTVQPDGRIILAGRAERGSGFPVDLGAVRLLNGPTVPDDRIFASDFDR